MLLEINEDAVKCRAHSIMEKPFEMVWITFGIFLSEAEIGDDRQFHEGPVSNRLNLSLGSMVLKDVDNFNEKLERAKVHQGLSSLYVTNCARHNYMFDILRLSQQGRKAGNYLFFE
ncbi:hypothetical protein [Methylobacter sp. sgz302048]|uniref:hypothetical protein n=1 Tax=Methylobacter sp. sgz302048 TaxID=3455945 RepID=UPI003FA16805